MVKRKPVSLLFCLTTYIGRRVTVKESVKRTNIFTDEYKVFPKFIQQIWMFHYSPRTTLINVKFLGDNLKHPI